MPKSPSKTAKKTSRGQYGMKSLRDAESKARSHAMKSAICLRKARTAEMAALRAAKKVAKSPRGSVQRKAEARVVRSNILKARRASECVRRELDASRKYADAAEAARSRMRERILRGLNADLRKSQPKKSSSKRR